MDMDMDMDKVYLFQNWSFGSNSLDEFRKWDTEGKILEKLKQQDIYVHTDSQWGFLIISLNKEKLVEVAEKKRAEAVEECECKLKLLKNLRFE